MSPFQRVFFFNAVAMEDSQAAEDSQAKPDILLPEAADVFWDEIFEPPKSIARTFTAFAEAFNDLPSGKQDVFCSCCCYSTQFNLT